MVEKFEIPVEKFEIPEEDQELFESLDLVRRRISDLNEILKDYKTTEQVLASKVFSKFGIPPGQTISFRDWIVTAIDGKPLSDPVEEGERSS
jgi:hypothetical protein